MKASDRSTSPSAAIQRQVKLPTAKAAEIAWKSIRLRLARSLIVTSGIVLALAFLMVILTNSSVIGGMREWLRTASSTPEFKAIQAQKEAVEKTLAPLVSKIRDEALANDGKLPKGVRAADLQALFGGDLKAIMAEVGSLPAPSDRVLVWLSAEPKTPAQAARHDVFRQWMASERELKQTRNQLKGPQTLRAAMVAEGVPIEAAEVRADSLQTRWLLGLALLVAFVGILNSMLMSVTERFREIGTMKCLGALNGFIVKLFLIESLFQGVIGTLIGVLLGLGVSLVGLYSSYGGYVARGVNFAEIGVSSLVCLLVGMGLTVASAVYPAWQAARMQPIEAMRVET